LTPAADQGANTVIGALVLLVSGCVLLVVHAAYQPYPLLGILLTLVLPCMMSKSWERPALGFAGALILIIVPCGGNEEWQIASLTLPDVAAALMVGIVALHSLEHGVQGSLRS
jgi:hypothetical protein